MPLPSPNGCTPAQAGAFLTAFRLTNKDEQPACAKSMRETAVRVDSSVVFGEGEGAVDIVRIGGDGHDTFHLSTSAGIVAAGAGARVCKVRVSTS